MFRGERFFKSLVLRKSLRSVRTAMSPCDSSWNSDWCKTSVLVFFVKWSSLGWRWQFGPKCWNSIWSSVNSWLYKFIYLSLLLGSRMFPWYNLHSFFVIICLCVRWVLLMPRMRWCRASLYSGSVKVFFNVSLCLWISLFKCWMSFLADFICHKTRIFFWML